MEPLVIAFLAAAALSGHLFAQKSNTEVLQLRPDFTDFRTIGKRTVCPYSQCAANKGSGNPKDPARTFQAF
jgi:hypothetical protein